MMRRRDEPAPAPRLALRLMGRFEVRRGSGARVTLAGRKAQALLAFLALPAGRAHPRDKLTGLFWPGADESHARQSLRQTVLELRRKLGGAPGLVADGDALLLDGQAVEVDVARFEHLARGSGRASLEEAARLYDGDLMEGFHVVSPPFEDWLVAERERLRQTGLAALGSLLAQQVNGPPEPAVRTAVRLLALDPLQEATHRTLMRLYVRQGRRTAALRQYRICARVLQQELDVTPDGETERLYRDLLHSQTRRPGPATPRPRPRARSALEAAPAFVGRREELADLRRASDDSRRGQARGVLVTGDAGIGKTSLVRRLTDDAARRGDVVLVGRCHESEQILPFGPWVDALRPVIAIPRSPLIDALPEPCRVELTRLFPTLDGAEVATPVPSRDYRPLFESIVALLEVLASRGPIVLVLEDLQWADDLSLRLLPFVARRVARHPVLLVATAREDGLAGGPELGRLVEELRQEPRFDILSLRPLDQADTLELLHLLLPVPLPGADAAERVWRASEGNPFVIVEIAQAVEAGGPEFLAGPTLLPARVRALVAARLDRLGEDARRVLDVAAVNGSECSFALLQQAAGLDEPVLIHALDELVRRRVLDLDGERIAITHERVREVAYGRLLEPQRRRLHRAVAEAIEALEGGAVAEVADRLANHYGQARHAPKAIEHLVRLADQAMRRYAFEDAGRALREAIAQAEHLTGPTRELRTLDLSVRLAFALSVLGRFREILELLLPLLPRLPAIDPPPALSGPYHFRLALTYAYLNEQAPAVQHAEQALGAAGRCGDAATAGKAHYTLALLSHARGDLRAGIEHAHAAVTTLDGTDERLWLGLAHWVLGLNQTVLGGWDAAHRAARRAEQIGVEIGDFRTRALAAGTLGWIEALRGEVDEGLAACARGLEIARDPISIAFVLRRLGRAHLAAGDPAAAATRLAEWRQRLGGLGAALGLSQGLAELSEALLGSGDVVRARAAAEESLREAAGDALGRACAQRALGLVARAEGRLGDAEEALGGARRAFEAIGAGPEVARGHLALAEVALARGQAEEAIQQLAAARGLFAVLGAPRLVEATDRLARSAGLSLPAADAAAGPGGDRPARP